MAQAIIPTINLFSKHANAPITTPKIVDIKDYWDPGAYDAVGSIGRFKKKLTIEFYCPIDQRILYQGASRIGKISSFLCGYDLDYLKSNNQNALKAINNLNPQELNDAIYDMQQINQDGIVEKIQNLIHFTDFELYQYGTSSHLNSDTIRNLTDKEAFGVNTKYQIDPVQTTKTSGRTQSSNKKENKYQLNKKELREQKRKQMEVMRKKSGTRHVFKNLYNSLIYSGIDPLLYFQDKENTQGFVEAMKGCGSIRKTNISNHEIRKTFKDYVNANIDLGVGFNIRSIEISNRHVNLKTRVELTLDQLETIRQVYGYLSGGVNIIFFAYDKAGNKIDTFDYFVNIGSLVERIDIPKPLVAFENNSVRNRHGEVITTIQNNEKQNINFKTYTKKISNYFSNIYDTFDSNGTFNIRKKSKIVLKNGKLNIAMRDLSYGTTTPIFLRTIYNYNNTTINNTKTSYVNSVSGGSNIKPYCSFYPVIMNDNSAPHIRVFVGHVSKNIRKITILKRVVTNGNRAPNRKSKEWKLLKDSKFNLQTGKKVTLDSKPNTKYIFNDYDIDDDVTYEYIAKMYTTSGTIHYSGHSCFEKYTSKGNAVKLRISRVLSDDIGTVADDLLGVSDSTTVFSKRVTFDIAVDYKENEIDAVLNSVFQEGYQLYLEEFKEVKDMSNLVFGIKASKINKQTGQILHVGDFKCQKRKVESDLENLQTNVKTYNISCQVNDLIKTRGDYLYKFSPYIMPPTIVISAIKQKIINESQSNGNNNRQIMSTRLLTQTFNAERNANYASALPRGGGSFAGGSFPSQRLASAYAANISTGLRRISSTAERIPGTGILRGQIQPLKQILEAGGNDILVEGITGDIVYHDDGESYIDMFGNIAIKDIMCTINKINHYNKIDNTQHIVSLVKTEYNLLNINVRNNDNFVDFYIILKRENSNKVTIDGAIHSLDNNLLDNRYKFISECNGSFGQIEYFTVPVLKDGTLASLIPLVSYVKGGNI